ncbi:MAG: MFS transporter [Gammaproteobacteria bacterium]|nr:MFS transporter [Gammaproteobacteria bacterium]MDE0414462.1 MFS transporter [Gammaproteobacteria bacterium]
MPDSDTPRTRPAYAWFVVATISLLQIGSYIDRMVINLLVEPMRLSFGLSDTKVSLLLGFAFAMLYACMAIPAGRLADSYSRVKLIVFSVVAWSLATLGCMLADGYWSLFAARMLVGLGEAALVPAGFSLLSDYFRPGKLALATSTVTASSFAGSGLALALGGLVIGRLPTTEFFTLPLVGDVRSWQLAFGFASIPSIVFLGLFFFVREPVRRGLAKDGGDGMSLASALAFLRRDKAMWISIFAGMSLLNAFQYGLTAWVPTFFIRTYGWSAADIGQLYGAAFLICATAGTISGGWLCDRLFHRFGPRTFIVTPLISAAITIPLVLGFALAGSGRGSAILVVPLTYFGTMSFGAAVAAIPSLAPNQIRGQLVAVYTFVGTLIGQGCGPWFIALFTDYVMGDPMMISRSIAVVSTSLISAAALILWAGLRYMPRNGRTGA